MKKQINTYMIAGALMLLSFSSIGQQQRKSSLISTDGYWVVEGNLHTPLQHTIRFYNNDNVLIGTKELGGVKLNTKKRKVKIMLKQGLESSLLAWGQKKTEPVIARSRP